MKLDFGTAGIRGLIGNGEEFLNEAHAARVFDGYAKYLLKKNECNNKEITIVIGRDNRQKGKVFANIAVKILTSYGIKVYFNKKMLPTPFISFLVKYKKAQGAINITASHNPKEYNGIKLYNNHGAQMLPKEVFELKKHFQNYQDYLNYLDFNEEIKDNNLVLDILKSDYQEYIKQIKQINYNNIDLSNIKVVYSSLHGTGYEFIKELFSSHNNIIYEKNEVKEDENFSFVSNPNPENKEAFKNTIKLANKENSDLIVITDPDSDRVGVAIKKDEDFVLLNGNETAILITDYLIKNKKRNNEKDYYLIYSFVSTTLPAKMCKENKIKSYVCETGFKWIGDLIEKLKGKEEFFFAFEESYGSLVLDELAHDKDAIQSLYTLVLIASEAKKQNMSLLDKLNLIYQQYGYMETKAFSYDLNSVEQLEKIKTKFRNLNFKNAKLIDYNLGIDKIEKNDMLSYEFENSSNWISLRPSGTEPKYKIYIHVVENEKIKAQTKFNNLYKIILDKVIN